MSAKMRPLRTIRRVRADEDHRVFDVAGVLFCALGLVTFLSLLLPDTGILGAVIGEGIGHLLGRGVWLAPIGFTCLGVAIVLGRRRIKVNHLTLGLVLVFVAVLGFLARPIEGDYFDAEAVRTTGGYFGAVIAWSLSKLLGQAMGVGLGALAMVGAIFCINVPLQVVLQVLHDRAKEMKARKVAKWMQKPEKKVPSSAKAVVEFEKVENKPNKPTISKETDLTQPSLSVVSKAIPKEGYVLPPLTVLAEPEQRPKRLQSEIQHHIQILESTLEEFGIEANVVEIAHGPTLTRYEIQLGPGIKVSRIKNLADNIAMSLSASHVRVEAPIPGKAAIGIEVPNSKRSLVTLREVASSEQFLNHESRVAICLGQDVGGENFYADLAKMPHLLIGGATNSGKSIGLAAIITSLLLRNTPKDLQLVLMDPKRVELTLFDDIPHLMCPVVREIKQMPGVLRQVWREMDRRYDVLAEAQARNIQGFNEKVSYAERLPYIVVVIDELADLMIQAENEVETSICRLAQLARATGIHLILATQRPSVDVITGTIKANISSRIAFSVSSQIDSRTILDTAGAEHLIGLGDMLFLPIDSNKPVRIQGCYVTEKEIAAVCDHWRAQAKPEYRIDPVTAVIEREETRMNFEESDPMWEEVVRWVVDRNQASTSMLQRRFSIGFQRASRLLDMMEERGIVAPRDGPRPREVLISPSELDVVLGRSTGPER
jgi:S-DNA-T family DNA segregation ATPase FtsK/SpoIIIE